MDAMYERLGKPADLGQQLLFLLGAHTTVRFHTVATVKENTLAAHSFGVAWLCYLLSDTVPSANLLMAALSHDLAEQVWGDIPSPVKKALGADGTVLSSLEENTLRDNQALFQLTEDETVLLKLADKIEVLMTCVYERRLGNRYMEQLYRRHLARTLELPGIERAEALLKEIQILWEESVGR